jgi:hypothetical protein
LVRPNSLNRLRRNRRGSPSSPVIKQRLIKVLKNAP